LTPRRVFLYSIPVWGTAVLTFAALQLLSPRMSAVFGNIDAGADGIRVLRQGRGVRPVNGDPLYQGDDVVVGAQPLAVVCLDGATVEFAAGTEVRLEGQNGKRFLLSSGSLVATVPDRRVEDPFAVRTDGALVTIHGTAFSVVRDGGAMVVSVAAGQASVEANGKTVKVEAGQVVRVAADGESVVLGD
jgi:hypothetical protein